LLIGVSLGNTMCLPVLSVPEPPPATRMGKSPHDCARCHHGCRFRKRSFRLLARAPTFKSDSMKIADHLHNPSPPLKHSQR
jgi:hypothetical protein